MRRLLIVLAACKSHDLAITLDGKLDEPAWNERAERHQLSGDHAPYAELRVLHDAHRVYLAVYASDEDIRSTDAFDVTIGGRALHLTPVSPGADHDGTVDQPGDYDEEWVVETAVSRADLPAPPLAIEVTRCDTPKDGVQRCASWRGTATLTP